jgi:hypothetical protein
MTALNPQPTEAPPTTPSPEPPWRRLPWLVITLAGVCMLLVGLVIGLLLSGSRSGETPGAHHSATMVAEPSATDPPEAISYTTTDEMRDALANNIISQCDAYQVHTSSVVPGVIEAADCKNSILLTVYYGPQDAEGGVTFSCLTGAYFVLGSNWTANCASSLEATAVALTIGGRIIPC